MLLGILKNMASAGIMNEDVLHTELGISEDTPINMELLGEKIAESDAAQALVTAYVSDVMDSALGIEREPSLTSDTVMDIVNPHIGELTDIVLECLPDDAKKDIDRTKLEKATREALQTALPDLVDSLPDVSDAKDALVAENPTVGIVLDVLKFIRTGAMRAIVLLAVVALIVILCLFRMPNIRGLRCVGICGVIGALLNGGIYLLLGMPYLQTQLAGALGEAGAIITEFAGGFAHEFAVCGVIYGVIGLLLILGTTVLRGLFSLIFGAIFSRD